MKHADCDKEMKRLRRDNLRLELELQDAKAETLRLAELIFVNESEQGSD